MNKQLIILLITLLSGQFALGQITPDIYTQLQSGGTFGKELRSYDPEVVFDEIIKVNERNPLIIKTPKQKEAVKIYVFNKIFTGKRYNAILITDDHPLKPKLITTDADGLQLSELQFLEHYGHNRANYEVFEEIKITSPTDIVLTTTTETWTLDKNGERITGSKKIITKVDKYQITDNGKIEKIKSE